MQIVVTENLNELARKFDKPLYLVGGYVRNALLGFYGTDIDIAAELTPEEVEKALLGTQFKAVCINRRLGTLKIYYADESYEYTTFRKDSYPQSGAHTPQGVFFTKEMAEDASRRDFKANAIYYDILRKEIVDPLGGVEDVKKGILSTTRTPDEVFGEDGLRIMRLCRLMAELGFEADEQTFLSAQKSAPLLKDISKERIKDEFVKILSADKKYPQIKHSSAHIRGLRLLKEVGALPYVLPELTAEIGFDQHSKFHKYDVFEHTLAVLGESEPDIRLAALFHDIAKPVVAVRDGNMKKHAEEGAVIAAKAMRRLKFPNSDISQVVALVKHHMYDLNVQTPEKELRRFIVDNHLIVPRLIALKRADIKGSGLQELSFESADRMEKLFTSMTLDGTPFSVKDLKVNGRDLIELDVEKEKRGALMKELFYEAVYSPELRSREAQLEFLRRKK